MGHMRHQRHVQTAMQTHRLPTADDMACSGLHATGGPPQQLVLTGGIPTVLLWTLAAQYWAAEYRELSQHPWLQLPVQLIVHLVQLP